MMPGSEARWEAEQGAGLSGAKTAALRDLAIHVDTGQLQLDRLGRRPDEQVLAELQASEAQPMPRRMTKDSRESHMPRRYRGFCGRHT